MSDSGDMKELGSSGLRRSGGYIIDEVLSALRGAPGRKVYREMSDNDAICGSILFGIERLILGQDWRVDPYHDEDKEPTPEDEKVAQFVDSCLHDMSESWESTLSGILTFLPFGWSYCETVMKRRIGPEEKDGSRRSNYTDGKIGWRKIVLRAQESLSEWDLDPVTGSVRGMIQSDPSVYGPTVTIPIERALLFRTTTARQNPEGKSILRAAYRPWYIKKLIEDVEAVGVERDMVGMPIGWVPPKVLSSTATGQDLDVRNAVKEFVRQMRRGDNDGGLFPLAYDATGNKLYDVTLLTSGGMRQFDTDKIIARWDQRIAMSVLADFILLGHENVGSFALGASKVDLFLSAVSQFAWSIAETFNRHAIPRLLRLNGMSVARCPKLAPTELSHVDLGVLGEYLSKMVAAGVIKPDDDLEDYAREVAGLPEALIDEDATVPMVVTPPLPPVNGPLGDGLAPGGPAPPGTLPRPQEVEKSQGSMTFSPVITVNVPEGPAPVVQMSAPPVVHVTVPESPFYATVNVPQAPAPTVMVNVPDAPAPVVNVDAPVSITVPQGPAPVVNVEVPQGPAPEAPVVHVHVPQGPAPVVNVEAPKPATLRVYRDKDDRIAGVEPVRGE